MENQKKNQFRQQKTYFATPQSEAKSRKAIRHAALQKQSTKPVDNSVGKVLIKSFDRHNTGLCYKLMIFSPNEYLI